MRIAAACLAKSLLRPFRAASGGGRRCLDLGDGRWRRSFSPRANRPQWGKPNTRVTGRKVDPSFGRNLGHRWCTECPEFARNFVFRSGDTKSSHFWCGNRSMPAQCLPLVRLSSLLRNRHLPNPLAAARYFAAGDTSVGFTPTATALELPRSLPSRIPAMRAGSAISRSATTTSAPCSAIRATWQGRSRATATALELSRSWPSRTRTMRAFRASLRGSIGRRAPRGRRSSRNQETSRAKWWKRDAISSASLYKERTGLTAQQQKWLDLVEANLQRMLEKK